MSQSSSAQSPSSPQNGLKSNSHHADLETVASRREYNDTEVIYSDSEAVDEKEREMKLVRKIDLRLCTIAGILCSLNLLDSGIISSASVTSIFGDLGLGVGNRYVSFDGEDRLVFADEGTSLLLFSCIRLLVSRSSYQRPLRLGCWVRELRFH
jgi:hypothetical protein